MTKPYFTLVSTVRNDHQWAIEFGDYSRFTVAEEMRDLRYSDQFADERREFKIIRTPSDDQATIDAAVAALNGHNSDLVETPIRNGSK